jgi:hypothetical protein
MIKSLEVAEGYLKWKYILKNFPNASESILHYKNLATIV